MRIGVDYGGVDSVEEQNHQVEQQVQRVVDAEQDGFDSIWIARMFGALRWPPASTARTRALLATLVGKV